MIRLTKGPEPHILVANGATWTAIWVDHVENGTSISDTDKGRYRHPEIKEAILVETAAKCAYCESKVTHVYQGDVEHIKPKRRRPDLFVAWPNLTLGCRICNGKKGDYYSEEQPLLDPYSDNPLEHLKFHGAIAMSAPGSQLGERTVLRLGLARAGLVERRTERINAVKSLIDKWATQPEGELKTLLLGEIETELSENREYTAALRAFAYEHAEIVVNN